MASGDVIFRAQMSAMNDSVEQQVNANYVPLQTVSFGRPTNRTSINEYLLSTVNVTATAPVPSSGAVLYDSAIDGTKQYLITVTEV